MLDGWGTSELGGIWPAARWLLGGGAPLATGVGFGFGAVSLVGSSLARQQRERERERSWCGGGWRRIGKGEADAGASKLMAAVAVGDSLFRCDFAARSLSFREDVYTVFFFLNKYLDYISKENPKLQERSRTWTAVREKTERTLQKYKLHMGPRDLLRRRNRPPPSPASPPRRKER